MDLYVFKIFLSLLQYNIVIERLMSKVSDNYITNMQYHTKNKQKKKHLVLFIRFKITKRIIGMFITQRYDKCLR